MNKLVNLTMFRGYVNKVLPTVYDDSLSYYEVLAKVMEKINEIINLDNAQNEIISNIPEDVSEFAEDLAQFKSSMTQQFNDFKTGINADFDAFEAEVNAKVAADSTPTQGSTKLVTSGGVYASLQDIINSLVKDVRPTEDSTNYVTSGGVWKAIDDAVEDLEATLNTKQNVLTWDTTPTANSTNPVQSGGIKTYVDNAKQAALDSLDNYITTNDSRVSGIEGDIAVLETGKQDTLTFDLSPTLGSNNPVTSNGIAQAIAGVTPSIEVDPVPTQGSTNPVSSNGVYVAVSDLETELEEGLADKQNTLTFDVLPTQNSLNPVTSGGVWSAIAQVDPSGTIDPEPTQGSTAAVSSGGTWTAINNLENELTNTISTKQDALTFDNTPTINSGNPVTSDGIYRALQDKQSALTFDSTPTQYSTNPVTSGGVYDAIQQGGGGGGTIDPTPTEDSTNAVQSGGVWTALQGKQNTLTFDQTPTQNSTNPVTSGGVWSAIQGGGGGGGISQADLDEASAYLTAQKMAAIFLPLVGEPYIQSSGLVSSYQYNGDLSRFSDLYSGGNFWSWLNTEYLINYCYRNNDGNPDFIKIGDYFPINCGTHGNYYAIVVGINDYKGKYYSNYGDSIDNQITFRFDKAWDVQKSMNRVATNNGRTAKPNPWEASELYLYCNSLSGDAINNASTTDTTTPVDYSADGVYYNLPAELQNVITDKIFVSSSRAGGGKSADDNAVECNYGKIWVPTEKELFGSCILGTRYYSECGSVNQYPGLRGSVLRESWLATPTDGNSTMFSYNGPDNLGRLAADQVGKFIPFFTVNIDNY